MITAHPAPELLVPYALGTADPATALHVESCATCRTEVEDLQEAAGLLRAPSVLDRRAETADCLDEFAVADFVDGQLNEGARAAVITHLLVCARCRALVKATSGFSAVVVAAEPAVQRRRHGWWVPAGIAAAAALAVLLFPSSTDDGSTHGLREPTVTSTVAPVPIIPYAGASVAEVDRLVWSSVPGADRYRVRLYDNEGSVLWTVETVDTSAALPVSVRLRARVPYFWRVEAQAEWMRWAASDLTPFQVIGSPR